MAKRLTNLYLIASVINRQFLHMVVKLYEENALKAPVSRFYIWCSATSHLALDGFNTLQFSAPWLCSMWTFVCQWCLTFWHLYHVPKPVSEVFNGFC